MWLVDGAESSIEHADALRCILARPQDVKTWVDFGALVGWEGGRKMHKHLPASLNVSCQKLMCTVCEEGVKVLVRQDRVKPCEVESLLLNNCSYLILKLSSWDEPALRCHCVLWFQEFCEILTYSVRLTECFSQTTSPQEPELSWDTRIRGCGGAASRVLASHPDKLASIPSRIALEFLHMGIMLDDAAGMWVFSGSSSFPNPRIPVLILTNLTSPSSALKTRILRSLPNISTPLHRMETMQGTGEDNFLNQFCLAARRRLTRTGTGAEEVLPASPPRQD
ncbi:hypothetical protein PR048_005015 [Dryococelus australis]|uniref:Uncharacterized protein n=1 Tax=Dryococelus australis TaxID=614101 RepID=A0ABQ9I855_9NEOP|nr:hypothetical protein PR048_005015 [Dryococelus australis]